MADTLRIIFMGTPDFAVATLEALVASNKNIVGVITAPDRPAGRGRKLQQSAVKKYAMEQGLHVLQPTNLKDDTFLSALKALNANLQIVVAFRMLPKAVWQMPKYGTFNLHASLLPNYRGAAPIHWAIINGETVTGTTTFFIDEKIDTGAIILQNKTTISQEDTTGTLHDKLMKSGAELVLETVSLIETDAVAPTQQSHIEIDHLKSAPKLNKEICQIDWSNSLTDIYNFIRGMNPYPVAWSYMQNGEETLMIKIYDVRMIPEKHTLPIGHLLATKSAIKVAVSKGFIQLMEIQLAGKRKMKVNEVLNGLKIEEKAKMF